MWIINASPTGCFSIGYRCNRDSTQSIAPPLSIFAHAVDANQQIVTQADGLNVSLSSLEPGDIIIQRLVSAQPGAAIAINLGLYNPATLQRRVLASNSTFDHMVVPLR
jgi:hypothetical protein